MWFVRRAVGVASRRLGRPELLAAVDPRALQAQREAIGISAVLASTLRSDGAYVDVGANRGQVLREAVRVAPSASHVAFEPIPALAAELARSFPGVDCRALALGAAPDVAQFCYFTGLDGWSGLRRSPHVSDAQGKPEYITVEVSTLDREIAQPPRVVKIDVEGAELAVLEGGRSLFSRARPVVIFEHVVEASSLYEAPAAAPWELLSELGYEIYAASGEGPFGRDAFAAAADVVNWLAVPSGDAAGGGGCST
jgi:FkbM family methyltransferase